MDLFATNESKISESRSIPINYKTITTYSEAESVLTSLSTKDSVAIDFCATYSDFLAAKLVGFSICAEKEKAYFISLPEDELTSLVKLLLENEEVILIGNHLKFQN